MKREREDLMQTVRSKNDPSGNGRLYVVTYKLSRRDDGNRQAIPVAVYLDQKPEHLLWRNPAGKRCAELPEMFVAPSVWLDTIKHYKRRGLVRY